MSNKEAPPTCPDCNSPGKGVYYTCPLSSFCELCKKYFTYGPGIQVLTIEESFAKRPRMYEGVTAGWLRDHGLLLPSELPDHAVYRLDNDGNGMWSYTFTKEE
jgi:hypothetical protein